MQAIVRVVLTKIKENPSLFLRKSEKQFNAKISKLKLLNSKFLILVK